MGSVTSQRHFVNKAGSLDKPRLPANVLREAHRPSFARLTSGELRLHNSGSQIGQALLVAFLPDIDRSLSLRALLTTSRRQPPQSPAGVSRLPLRRCGFTREPERVMGFEPTT